MATQEVTGRQYPLYAEAVLDSSNSGDGLSINVPPGAVIVSGFVRVTAVAATGVTLSVKDNAIAPVSLFGDVAADAKAATALTTTGLGLSYPAGGKLTVALSAADSDAAATVGVAYVIGGRVNEPYSA